MYFPFLRVGNECMIAISQVFTSSITGWASLISWSRSTRLILLFHSVSPARLNFCVLSKSITTYEDKKWTKKYHDKDPKKKCFGGKVIIKMKNGKTISEEIG